MRASREPLSRERVLGAALKVADEHGVGAVTMRRVAAELHVEAMSLYRHVAGKEQLLDGLVEQIVTEVEANLGDLPADEWRQAIRRRCLAAREVMQRHRWAPGLIGTRTTIPIPLYGYYDAILATLINGGFSYHLAHQAIHSLGSMVLGFTQELFSPAAGGDENFDEAGAEAELAAMADALPHLTAMIAAEMGAHQDDPLGWCDSQSEFEFTLDLLLDGFARHLGR